MRRWMRCGRSWSTQMNQPTAELYMLDADEQFPYRLYAPQQDNSTYYVANVPPYAWPIDEPILSPKDASAPRLRDVSHRLIAFES